MKDRIGRTLGRFHHRVYHHMEGMQPAWNMAGRWEYIPLGMEMTSVGLEEVETYVFCHQNTVDQYIATRPILDLCLAKEWQPGEQVSQQWW